MTIAYGHQAPTRFELVISCLLDRRFNQLSHGAIHTYSSYIDSQIELSKQNTIFISKGKDIQLKLSSCSWRRGLVG